MPNIFAFSALRRPPRKKPRNQEPRNLVTATAATETSEDGRSTTEDVKIPDLTEQLDVKTARIRALESEVKKKVEQVDLIKCSLYKAERALEIAAQERSQLEKCLSRKFSAECFQDSPDDMNVYRGFPDYLAVVELFEFLDPGENCENAMHHKQNDVTIIPLPPYLGDFALTTNDADADTNAYTKADAWHFDEMSYLFL
ncbi:hypothetical protein HPB51_019085 [Rhipicephalus microplus]|uniref:Uncharacterized protein n=1 Tax=Rhipicephalus microplus TaxID=6941 RepID=A0A9J6EIS7_RHIMP|nr:hypothetical protein HPB51_019085 [Rhipicephalus microplus]